MYFHYFHYYDYIYVYNGLLLFLCGCQTCCFQAHLPGGGPDHHRHCRLFRVPQAESQWMALRCRTDGSVLSQVLGKVPDGRDGPLCTPAAGFKNAATHSTINMCYLVIQYNYIYYIYIYIIYLYFIYLQLSTFSTYFFRVNSLFSGFSSVFWLSLVLPDLARDHRKSIDAQQMS